jgi:hypothetical protein
MTVGDRWQLSIDPPVLLPGRTASSVVQFTPDRDLQARGVVATLRCVERYRYDRSETSAGPNGTAQTRSVTHTDHNEIHRLDVPLAGPLAMAAGQQQTWPFQLEVPGLGPATFEGEELRCDWTLETSVDLPMRPDERFERRVAVAQPTALLKAGVVDVGQYGLFDEAPTNLDAFPAQIRLEPMPICLGQAFSGAFTVETAEPIEVREVRLELRVHAQVTVSGGHREEIMVQRGRLEADAARFGGPFAVHRFQADAVDAWLPSIDLPHGTARGVFSHHPGASLGTGHPLRPRRGPGHYPSALGAAPPGGRPRGSRSTRALSTSSSVWSTQVAPKPSPASEASESASQRCWRRMAAAGRGLGRDRL